MVSRGFFHQELHCVFFRLTITIEAGGKGIEFSEELERSKRADWMFSGVPVPVRLS